MGKAISRRALLWALIIGATGLVAVPGPAFAQSDRVGVNPAVTQVEEPSPPTTDPAVPGSAPVPAVPSETLPETTIPVITPSPSVVGPGPTLAPPGVVPVVDPNAATPTSPETGGTAPTEVNAPATTIAASTKTKAGVVTPPRTTAELQQRLDAILGRVPGVVASVSVDGLGVVYDRSADKGVIPASTQKIYTIGAALLRLGGDKRFVTDIRASAIPSGVVLSGDLVIRGSGDPSFSGNGVAALADSVVRSGIKEVTGDLVVDESHFDAQRTNDGWKASFTPGEVGSLSAFTVNGNHQGGKATLDPAVANLATVRAALKKRGVVVRGVDRRGLLPLGGPVLGSVTSAPLRDLAAYALKKSENTYAELLLKELGASAGNGSTPGGIALVNLQFAAFGVTAPVMADGSGLSSLNRSTARQQVAWLTKLRTSPEGDDFRKALPVACVDGTLKSRFCKTAGAGKIQAKTGTLNNITALSGYGVLPSGRGVVFSFIGNALPSSSKARAAIDEALLVALTSTVA